MVAVQYQWGASTSFDSPRTKVRCTPGTHFRAIAKRPCTLTVKRNWTSDSVKLHGFRRSSGGAYGALSFRGGVLAVRYRRPKVKGRLGRNLQRVQTSTSSHGHQ